MGAPAGFKRVTDLPQSSNAPSGFKRVSPEHIDAIAKSSTAAKTTTKSSSNLWGDIEHAAGELGTGINRGLSDNPASFLIDKTAQGLNLIPGVDINNPVGGSHWVQQHLMPKPMAAKSVSDQALQAAGQGVGGVLGWEGTMGASGLTPAIESGAQLAKNLGLGALSAEGAKGGQEIAHEAFPNSGLAPAFGSLVGGLTIPAAADATGYAVGTPIKLARGLLSKSAAENAAANTLRSSAHSPDMLNFSESQTPGVNFLLGDATGDPDLIRMQRSMRRNPDTGSPLLVRTEENNQALSNQLGAIRGKANPDELTANAEAQQNALAKQHASNVANTRQAANEALANVRNLSGGGNSASASRALHQALNESMAQNKATRSEMFGNLAADMPAGSHITPLNFGEASKDFLSRYPDIFGRLPDQSLQKQLESFAKGSTPTTEETGLLDASGNPITRAKVPSMNYDQFDELDKQLGDYLSRALKSSGDVGSREASAINGVRNALRQDFNDWIERDNPELGPQRQEAWDYSGKMVRPFKEGTLKGATTTYSPDAYKIGPESAGSAIFHGGKNGAQDVQQALRVLNPEGKQALQQYALRDLHENAINPNTGELQANRVRSWMDTHGDALDALPNVKRAAQDLHAKAQAAEDSVNAQKAAESEFKNSPMGRWATNDAQHAIRKILSSPNPAKEIGSAMQAFGKEGIPKLRAAFLDHMAQQSMSRVSNTAGGLNLRPSTLNRFLQDNQKAFERLFTKEQQKVIRGVASDADRMSLSERTQASGSPTLENQADASSFLGKLRGLWHSHGGNAGAAVATHGASAAAHLLTALRDKRIGESLDRAMQDPQYAKWLLKKATPANVKMAPSKYRAALSAIIGATPSSLSSRQANR